MPNAAKRSPQRHPTLGCPRLPTMFPPTGPNCVDKSPIPRLVSVTSALHDALCAPEGVRVSDTSRLAAESSLHAVRVMTARLLTSHGRRARRYDRWIPTALKMFFNCPLSIGRNLRFSQTVSRRHELCNAVGRINRYWAVPPHAPERNTHGRERPPRVRRADAATVNGSSNCCTHNKFTGESVSPCPCRHGSPLLRFAFVRESVGASCV